MNMSERLAKTLEAEQTADLAAWKADDYKTHIDNIVADFAKRGFMTEMQQQMLRNSFNYYVDLLVEAQRLQDLAKTERNLYNYVARKSGMTV